MKAKVEPKKNVWMQNYLNKGISRNAYTAIIINLQEKLREIL